MFAATPRPPDDLGAPLLTTNSDELAGIAISP
jgi:hypothetical protein